MLIDASRSLYNYSSRYKTFGDFAIRMSRNRGLIDDERDRKGLKFESSEFWGVPDKRYARYPCILPISEAKPIIIYRSSH
jgi:hypothetical protein